MKQLAMLAVTLALGIALAQSAFYAPDGEYLAPGEGTSIRMMVDEHFPGALVTVHFVPEEVSQEKAAVVVFAWLTDRPLFAITRQPERIPEFIASFDLLGLLGSWQLAFELESNLGVADLTVVQALGAPSNRMTRTSELGRVERWEYDRYGLLLYFTNGGLSSVTRF